MKGFKTMKKIIEKEIHTTIKIKASEDGTHAYSYTKEFTNMDGKSGIFIMLYPTRNQDNFFVDDSTNMHIQNHITELGLKSYTVVNLFSTVTSSRLSTKGLLLDTENLEFLDKEIFSEINTDTTEVIIAWGNSHLTSKAVNTMKKQVLELWFKRHGTVALKQLTTDKLPKETAGAHPLYMGIRFNNSNWKLGMFPTKKELKTLSEKEKTSSKKVKQNSQTRKNSISVKEEV